MSLAEQLEEERRNNFDYLHYYNVAQQQNDQLRIQNGQLKTAYSELSQRVERQTSQLASVQNKGREKNEEMKRKDEKIRQLQGELQRERMVRQEQANPAVYQQLQSVVYELRAERAKNLTVISDLRQKNRDLTKKVEVIETEQVFDTGRMRALKEQLEAEKQKTVAVQNKFEANIIKIQKDHKKEVKCLEESLKSINEQARYLYEELQKRVNESSLTHSIHDLQNRLQAKENYIEHLKEQKEEGEVRERNLQRDQKLYVSEFSKLQTELTAVKDEKARILEELRILKEGNRRDLDDTSCLICFNEMNEDGVQFQQLPRCTGCKRRYHGDCISQWFNEKIECPVCKKDGMDMENINRLNVLSATLNRIHL